MPTLDQLLVKIDASTELLRRELIKGEGSVDKFQQGIDNKLGSIEKRFGKLGSSIRTVLGAFGVGLSVAGITQLVRSSVALGDSINDAANAAGIGAERLQRLQYAFQQNGVEIAEFDSGMQRLNRNLGSFIQTGGGPAAKAIKQLGLEADITSGKIRTSEQLFDAIVERLGKVKTAAEQSTLAAELFGREVGPKMVAGLNLGIDGLKAFENAATGVLSDEQVKKAAELNDAFDRLSRTIGNTLKGAIVDATKSLVDFLDYGRSLSEGEIEKEITKLLDRAIELRQALRGEIWSPFSTDSQIREELEEVNMLIDLFQGKIIKMHTTLNKPPARNDGVVGSQIITQLSAIPEERGESPAFVRAGPNLFPTREEFADVREQLRLLEEQTLRSQGKMADAIRMAADAQIREWERVAEETPAFADEAAQAIVMINERAASDITKALKDAEPDISRFADAFAAAFESRGIDALLNGDISGAIRGLAKDIAELILRLVILRPLAASLGGIFGGIVAPVIAPIPGRASGGPVAANQPYYVHKDELFVPQVSGRVMSAQQTERMMGGVSVNQNFNVQAGLPAQWQSQLASATQIAAAAAKQAVDKEFSGRR